MKVFFNDKIKEHVLKDSFNINTLNIDTFLQALKNINIDKYNILLDKIKDPYYKKGLSIILDNQKYKLNKKISKVEITKLINSIYQLKDDNIKDMGVKTQLNNLKILNDAEIITDDFKSIINGFNINAINTIDYFDENNDIDIIYLTEDGVNFKIITREGFEVFKHKYFNKGKYKNINKEIVFLSFDSAEDANKHFNSLNMEHIKDYNMYEITKIKSFSEELDLVNEMIDYIDFLIEGVNQNEYNIGIIEEIYNNLYYKSQNNAIKKDLQKKLNNIKDKKKILEKKEFKDKEELKDKDWNLEI